MPPPTLSTRPTPRDLSAAFAGRLRAEADVDSHPLVGPVVVARLDKAAIRPRDEPLFARLVEDWGYPAVGRPWTDRHPAVATC